jgi:hypothetical protein
MEALGLDNNLIATLREAAKTFQAGYSGFIAISYISLFLKLCQDPGKSLNFDILL